MLSLSETDAASRCYPPPSAQRRAAPVNPLPHSSPPRLPRFCEYPPPSGQSSPSFVGAALAALLRVGPDVLVVERGQVGRELVVGVLLGLDHPERLHPAELGALQGVGRQADRQMARKGTVLNSTIRVVEALKRDDRHCLTTTVRTCRSRSSLIRVLTSSSSVCVQQHRTERHCLRSKGSGSTAERQRLTTHLGRVDQLLDAFAVAAQPAASLRRGVLLHLELTAERLQATVLC
eukprot:SAG22_NODE_1180_length_5238_cov_2.463125_8_plen_234_part_00